MCNTLCMHDSCKVITVHAICDGLIIKIFFENNKNIKTKTARGIKKSLTNYYMAEDNMYLAEANLEVLQFE